MSFIIRTENGERTWSADNADHAVEQHQDAFPDEEILSVRPAPDALAVTFSDDASTATYAAVLGALEGWTIDIDRTNDGYPDEGVIKDANEVDGLTVYECDVNGAPIVNSTYCIPWEVLTKVVIR